MEPQITPISADDSFSFGCHSKVPCFNACCRDLNQFLTPYEILRLKTHLKLDAETFLARYTQSHTGPSTGLPIITLKPGPGKDLPCPFVSSAGCRVYPDRPASCRIYPLMRGVQRDAQSGALVEHYAVLREPHCRGFEQPANQTVAQWVADQGLAPYNTMNDRMAAIIATKARHQTGPLDLRRSQLFRLALYDLDNFHRHVFDKGLLAGFPLKDGRLESARRDQTALLDIAFTWITQSLF